MTTSPQSTLPAELQSLITTFQQTPESERLKLLLHFSKKVPPLPEALKGSYQRQVDDGCKTPFFILPEASTDGLRIHFEAPQDATMLWSFAGLLITGLKGANSSEIMAVPNDFYSAFEMEKLLTPMRSATLGVMLMKLKEELALL